MSQIVLITGSSRGFGKLMATTLLEQGHVPVAAMRNVEGENKACANALRDQGIPVVELDLADGDSVEAGVRRAIEMFGKVDVLVNNAGVVIHGPQESFTVEDFQRALEVNLFGVHRINRVLIPHFRKRQAGLIIYMSGVTGRFASPFLGSHNVSNFALEALAETYHWELSHFGIETVIVQPDYFPTSESGVWDVGSDIDRVGPYHELLKEFEQDMKSIYQFATRPAASTSEAVAQRIGQLIEMPKGQRPLRTTIGHTLSLTPYVDKLNESYDAYLAELNDHIKRITQPGDE